MQRKAKNAMAENSLVNEYRYEAKIVSCAKLVRWRRHAIISDSHEEYVRRQLRYSFDPETSQAGPGPQWNGIRIRRKAARSCTPAACLLVEIGTSLLPSRAYPCQCQSPSLDSIARKARWPTPRKASRAAHQTSTSHGKLRARSSPEDSLTT